MPTVPVFRSKETPPPTLGLRNPSPEDLGKGIGDTLTVVGQTFQKVNSARNLNNLTTQLQKETSDFIFELESNPDSFETWEADVDTFLERRGGELRGQAKTGPVSDAFNREFNRVSLIAQTNIRAKARKRLIDVGRGDLHQNLLDMQKVYAKQTSDITRKSVLADANLKLEIAQDSLLIGDEELVKMRENFQQDAFSARVRNEMALNPSIALERLINNEYGLSAENNSIWRERAESAVEVERKEQVRLAEKKERKEAAAITAEQNALEGTLLSGIVDYQEAGEEVPSTYTHTINNLVFSQKLRPEQARSLLNDIKNDRIPSDTAVYDAIDAGIEDEGTVVNNEYIRRIDGLAVSDRKFLITKNNSFQNKKLKNDYKQGGDQLLAAIRTKIGQFSPFAKEDEADKYKLEALPELRERLESKEPLGKILEDMLPRYTKAPKTISSLPTPRYGVRPTGKEETIQRLADIKLTVLENGVTLSNIKSLNREIALLETYLEAFEKTERKR